MFRLRGQRTKYGNVKVGGYDSRLEFWDAIYLKNLVAEGVITDLREQVSYPIRVNDKPICKAIVDFQFKRNGKTIYYETKGFHTEVYRLKRKLIEATLGEHEVYLVNANQKQIEDAA